MRVSGTANEFTVFLHQPIVKTHPSHYLTASIDSAEVPFTWYQINKNNNTLVYSLEANHGVLTLSEGNYNVNQLLAEITVQLANVGVALQTRYTATNNKVAMRQAGPPVTLRWSQNVVLGAFFGCLTDKVVADAWVVGDRHVMCNPVTSIYIRSEFLRQMNSCEMMCEVYDSSDILCKIPVRTAPGTVLFHENAVKLENRLTNACIDQLNLYLSDNSSYALDLNGSDWTCAMTLREIRPLGLENQEAYSKTKDIRLAHPLDMNNTNPEYTLDQFYTLVHGAPTAAQPET